MLQGRKNSLAPQSPKMVPSPRAVEAAKLKGWGDLELEGGFSLEGKDEAKSEKNKQSRPRVNTTEGSLQRRKTSLDGHTAKPPRARAHSSFTLESVDGGRDVRIVSPVRSRRESLVQTLSERNIHVTYKQLRVATHPETGEIFKTFFTTYVVLDAASFGTSKTSPRGKRGASSFSTSPAQVHSAASPADPYTTSYTFYVINQSDPPCSAGVAGSPLPGASTTSPTSPDSCKFVTRYTHFFNGIVETAGPA